MRSALPWSAAETLPGGTTCPRSPPWRVGSSSTSVYLGHKGSYIHSEDALAEALAAVPNLGLKIDPVGLIRNLDADPNDILFRFGANLVYFHVKGLTRLRDGEIKPPPGFDAPRWDVMFGILLEHEYDGYVSVEPHGPYWAAPPERRKAYIRHTLRVLGPLMGSG